ncbi:hypothetical protein CMI48_03460 [Candidatus Pacearchaeota archaeon]|nr:hypothetical protein [Candidatus Pacearchaeota archaeon]|tara:strand:- start:142 stop:555 length:414 start_codon:yes stop_codon:yes gene_type:complete
MKHPKRTNTFLDKIGHLENHPTITHEKTLGQHTADNLTKWAGSWTFILTFIVFLILWMAANVYGWLNNWDPYPFILLNLVLSCLAALQAPIILMSQNREGQKDRIRAEYDYAVNRRSLHDVEDMKKQLDRIEKKLKK